MWRLATFELNLAPSVDKGLQISPSFSIYLTYMTLTRALQILRVLACGVSATFELNLAPSVDKGLQIPPSFSKVSM